MTLPTCLEIARAAGLEKETTVGQEIKFRCPNHEDHNPSLSVNPSKDVWMCGPCDASGNAWKLAAFLAGVSPGDKAEVARWLSDHGLAKARGPLVATYDYKDENGKVLFQVCRFEPKDFRQRQPKGKGGWIPSLKGVRAVPYNLPEVLRASWVVVCEGEKDADNLREWGITATCNSGGAGKWKPEFNELFTGKKVVIIPDADPPGERHAAEIARNLLPVAADLKIVRLGIKDFSEWKAAGGTKEGYLQLIKLAPAFTTADLKEMPPQTITPPNRVVCLKDVQAEAVGWLWRPFIPLGKLSLLEGDPGVGKSWITAALATAVSLGRGLPGTNPTAPGNVLLFSAEDGLGDTLKPRLESFGADCARVFAFDGPVSFDETGLEEIESHIARLRPLLVCIDPLVAYIGAKVDIHRANETRAVMAGMARLANQYGCAILGVRHLSKGSKDRAIYRGQGSIDFTAACRSVLLAGSDPDSPAQRAIVQIKCNLAAFGEPIGYAIEAGRFEWTGASDLTANKILSSESDEEPDALAAAQEFLAETLKAGPMRANDVFKEAKAAGISERTLKRAKAALRVKSERITEPGIRGVRGHYWILPLSRDLQCQAITNGEVGTLNPTVPLNLED